MTMKRNYGILLRSAASTIALTLVLSGGSAVAQQVNVNADTGGASVSVSAGGTTANGSTDGTSASASVGSGGTTGTASASVDTGDEGGPEGDVHVTLGNSGAGTSGQADVSIGGDSGDATGLAELFAGLSIGDADATASVGDGNGSVSVDLGGGGSGGTGGGSGGNGGSGGTPLDPGVVAAAVATLSDGQQAALRNECAAVSGSGSAPAVYRQLCELLRRIL